MLVDVIKANGGSVTLSTPVSKISIEGGRAVGLLLADGRKVKAKRGVVCNANIWSVGSFFDDSSGLTDKQREFFMIGKEKKYTKSFMHLHLGLNSQGLDMKKLKAHYTVLDQGLHIADPCADRNMVAVSNPGRIDNSLTGFV